MTTPTPDALTERLRAALAETAQLADVPPPPAFSWEDGPSAGPRRGRRGRRRRRPGRVAVALSTAGIAAAVAGALLLPAGTPSPEVAPAAFLTPGGTTPMDDGQFFYSRWTVQRADDARSVVVETWQPQVATDEWTRRITRLAADGTPESDPQVRTAACGDFATLAAVPAPASACDGVGSWSRPTPEFLASLPTDPAQLYESLHDYVVADYQRSANDRTLDMAEANVAFLMMNYIQAIGAETGGLSQTFSAALEDVAARVPGVVVRHDVANLTGVRGTSYEMDAPNGNVAGPLVFDAHGNYVGGPESALVVGAADEAGQPPAGLGAD